MATFRTAVASLLLIIFIAGCSNNSETDREPTITVTSAERPEVTASTTSSVPELSSIVTTGLYETTTTGAQDLADFKPVAITETYLRAMWLADSGTTYAQALPAIETIVGDELLAAYKALGDEVVGQTRDETLLILDVTQAHAEVDLVIVEVLSTDTTDPDSLFSTYFEYELQDGSWNLERIG